MVDLDIGVQKITFMVDTGAEHSVVTSPVAPLTNQTITIMGATRDQAVSQPFCRSRTYKVGGHVISHEFLYVPECLIPLLGRDLPH